MIGALILDADGVVINGDHAWDYFNREHGITRAMTQPFFRGPFLDCLVGKADLREVIAPYLVEWRWLGSVDAYLAAWFQAENHVDEGLMAVVASLRATGLPCYLATNQERYRTAYIQDKMGLGARLDGIFYSADVGFRKPQPEFFDAVAESLRPLAPESLLLLDDAEANVVAARACGWQAELYMSSESPNAALELHRLLL
jgi:putative hydrolase of the HAD superfamily